MATVILVIHLILALSIIALVMLQRSEGGGLGIGGGGGMGGLATAGQTANVLTRTTGILAAGFFTTSLILAILAGTHRNADSVLDSLDKAPVTVDSPAQTNDKDLPKADVPKNEEQPQSGAPSAPISQ